MNTTEHALPLRCSVIIPAYHAAAYVVETIKSVQRQTINNWEIVLVDDGSTDDTLEKLSALQDSRLRVVSQANAGPSAARNHGLRLALAPLVVFLDSDDELAPNALERLIAPLETDATLVASYGEATTIDNRGRHIGTGQPPVFGRRPSGDVVFQLAQRNFILTGSLCLRRCVASAVGGYREDLHVAEDLEFWCRIALEGPFVYIGGPPVLLYRIHDGSVVRTRGKNPADALVSIAAIYENPRMRRRLGGDAILLRRNAEAAIYSFTANEYLRTKEWRMARGLLIKSLRLAPLQPRELVLLPFTLIGWLPAAMRRRLK